MADERIDIEITDKVDPNIEKKIVGIADASTKGYTNVQKLKAALKDINTSAVSKLAAASASATSSLAKQLAASSKVQIAQTREAEAAARLALATQRVATEQAKTAAATLRAQAASDRAAAAKDKEASASAALQRELAREASAKTRVIHDASTVVPGTGANLGGQAGDRATAAAQTNQMRRTSAPIIAPEEVKTINDAAPAVDKLNQSLGKAGVGAGLARHQMVNLGYQIQDIIVSLQAGQAPLTVFIQQGSQIAGIAASAGIGLGGMAKAVWALLAPFAPLVIALAAAYFGFKQFTENSASAHSKELQDYANSLGLTHKEMRKLGNESVDASGKLKSFNTVTITMGDSWNGFKATVAEGLSDLVAPFEGVTGYFKTGWNYLMQFMGAIFIAFYGVVVGGMKAVARIIMQLPSVVANTVKSIVNQSLDDIEFLVNGAIKGLNWVIDGAAPILAKVGVNIGHIGEVGFGRVKKTGKDAFEVIADSVFESMGEADATLKGFAKRWDQNNLKAAKDRIKNAADAIISNRNPKAPKKPKADHTAENRAHALDVLNLKLDDELKRMKMLKPEREIQQRYDQIEAELLQKKIKLNDAEKASIMGKIKAIESYKFVQAESDRIYESAVAPLRTYNATTEAAAALLKQSAISQAQFNEAVNLGKRAYAEATDPLFSMKEALTQGQTASMLYGKAVEQNSYAEQVRQAFLAKGIDLTTNATAAQKAEAAAIIAKNAALQNQNFIQSQVGAIVNPIMEAQQMVENKAAMYAEIDRLRQADLLSEQEAQRARLALDEKFRELRTGGMASMFGELAKLSSAGNQELAAIGKAAAVAQATMDGYVAVQKALASGPPPFNYIQAAAVGVMTGVQVAGILSTNVGSFATGGQFMVDGRAGVDNNNINMNVSRGERITVETAAQQRAADSAGGASERPLNLKVVNVTDPNDIEALLADPDNDHLVLNVLARNPAKARQLTGQNG